MPSLLTPREALLDAAKQLLAAHKDRMITAVQWDALAVAVRACDAPAPPPGNESFMVEADGGLARLVVPAQGSPYLHRCPRRVFEAVAREVARHAGAFYHGDLLARSEATRCQAVVAVAFLRSRRIVDRVGARRHAATGQSVLAEARAGYEALRDAAK